MVLIVTLIGGVGSVACANCPPVREARLERLGGLLLVAGLIGLGYGLAQAGA